MDKLCGHEKARKVGDMRVTGITGEYPTNAAKDEAEMSPWESFNPASEQKPQLTIAGAATDQKVDYPTEALRKAQNKPKVHFLSR